MVTTSVPVVTPVTSKYPSSAVGGSAVIPADGTAKEPTEREEADDGKDQKKPFPRWWILIAILGALFLVAVTFLCYYAMFEEKNQPAESPTMVKLAAISRPKSVTKTKSTGF